MPLSCMPCICMGFLTEGSYYVLYLGSVVPLYPHSTLNYCLLSIRLILIILTASFASSSFVSASSISMESSVNACILILLSYCFFWILCLILIDKAEVSDCYLIGNHNMSVFFLLPLKINFTKVWWSSSAVINMGYAYN